MVTLLSEILENLEASVVPISIHENMEQTFIYGIGTTGQDVYRILSKLGIQVLGFLDYRLGETRFLGRVPIFSPDDDSLLHHLRASSKIILAIHNREVDQPTLIARLNCLGYANFISMVDLYDNIADELGVRYWLTRRTFYRNYKTQINAASDLWVDDLSCEIYTKTLQFRVCGDFSLLPEPDITHQYFPPDLPQWKQPIRLIDCGAYDGNVILDFIRNAYSFSAVAAFEPDMQNYNCLVTNLKKIGKIIHEICLFPCGVYATSRNIRFASGLGEANGIAPTGNMTVQCVALDDALPIFTPTLIKMDIEGAEMEALLGARRIILEYHPALAISVYHTPAHIWEIPLWVAQFAKENGINYTYYLRSHAFNCFDTIFYAVPNS